MILYGVAFSPLNLTSAVTDYASDLPLSYSNGCLVCHLSESGGGDLNGFGSDFMENGNDIEAISNMDSDGDGHTNEEELEAGTFPGDPDSAPLNLGGWTNIAIAAVGLTLVAGIVFVKFRAK